MASAIDISSFAPYLNRIHVSDGVMQGTHLRKYEWVIDLISQAAAQGLKEVEVDGSGLDRPLACEVLRSACVVHEAVIIGTVLKLILPTALPTPVKAEAEPEAFRLSSAQTVAQWPLLPDEEDDIAQRRHLRKVVALLACLVQGIQNNQSRLTFEARGYDRLWLRRVIHILLPSTVEVLPAPNENTTLSISFHHLKASEVKKRNERLKAVEHTPVGSLLPGEAPFGRPRSFTAPDVSLPGSEVARSRSETLSDELFPQQTRGQLTARDISGFVETYLVHCLVSDIPLANITKEYVTDPTLLLHFRLGLETLLVSPKLSVPHVADIRELLSEVWTVDTFLTRLEALESSLRSHAVEVLGGPLFFSCLRQFPQMLSAAFDAARLRSVIERKVFEIRESGLANSEKTHRIPNISPEQVVHRIWPPASPKPLVQHWVDSIYLFPPPESTFFDRKKQREIYFYNLLTALAKGAKSPLEKDPNAVRALTQWLLNPTVPGTHSDEEAALLNLLRAASFSAFGHSDTLLRNTIFPAAKGYTIWPLANTLSINCEYSFNEQGECVILRNGQYALLNDKRECLANFILRSRWTYSLQSTESHPFKLALTMPVFCDHNHTSPQDRATFYQDVLSRF